MSCGGIWAEMSLLPESVFRMLYNDIFVCSELAVCACQKQKCRECAAFCVNGIINQ
jgi:hypothetical protein